MNDILSLATRLRHLDDRALTDQLRQRTFSSAGIKDFFDLAEALLESTSVQQALSRLDRHTLAALITAGESFTESTAGTADAAAHVSRIASALHTPVEDIVRRLGRAERLLLADLSGDRTQVYDVVLEQLRSWPVFG